MNIKSIQPFLTAARNTASTTALHVRRLSSWAIAQLKVVSAKREALNARAVLGEKLYGAGLGEPQTRTLLNQLDERIANLRAAGSSTRRLENERWAAHASIGLQAIGLGRMPSGLESEFAAAYAAHQRLESTRHAASDARSLLRSMHARHAAQIAGGYACIALLLLGTAWASQGASTTQTAPPDPAPSVDQTGSDAPNPEPAPDFASPDANVDQTSICFNCNGTGQTNCLQCFGTGKRSCFNCNSTGKTVNNMLCFQCNGTGQQNCSFCQYGRVQCPRCFGAGRR